MRNKKIIIFFFFMFSIIAAWAADSCHVLSGLFPYRWVNILLTGILCTIVFYLLSNWISKRILRTPLPKSILEFVGVLTGTLLSAMLSIPLSKIPGFLGSYGPLLLTITLITLVLTCVEARIDFFISLLNRVTGGKFQISEIESKNQKNVLLDTSVIIDGRIADIAETGFIPGDLIIPQFILQELQYIADSEDSQRRQRGRRGLEILSRMRNNPKIEVVFSDYNPSNIKEADAKLIAMALDLQCPIVTIDYNLNKVADLQGIDILNVNDLTNAVKSILLPGEQIRLLVIQEGKEQNQGVGYLEDGTMVVIENGRPYLNHEIDVTVTKFLQTAAGRMIFARHESDYGVKR